MQFKLNYKLWNVKTQKHLSWMRKTINELITILTHLLFYFSSESVDWWRIAWRFVACCYRNRCNVCCHHSHHPNIAHKTQEETRRRKSERSTAWKLHSHDNTFRIWNLNFFVTKGKPDVQILRQITFVVWCWKIIVNANELFEFL